MSKTRRYVSIRIEVNKNNDNDPWSFPGYASRNIWLSEEDLETFQLKFLLKEAFEDFRKRNKKK